MKDTEWFAKKRQRNGNIIPLDEMCYKHGKVCHDGFRNLSIEECANRCKVDDPFKQTVLNMALIADGKQAKDFNPVGASQQSAIVRCAFKDYLFLDDKDIKNTFNGYSAGQLGIEMLKQKDPCDPEHKQIDLALVPDPKNPFRRFRRMLVDTTECEEEILKPEDALRARQGIDTMDWAFAQQVSQQTGLFRKDLPTMDVLHQRALKLKTKADERAAKIAERKKQTLAVAAEEGLEVEAVEENLASDHDSDDNSEEEVEEVGGVRRALNFVQDPMVLSNLYVSNACVYNVRLTTLIVYIKCYVL